MAKNRFLDKKWQKSHLKKIKERAGSRYTPKLNIDLPIADIFDGISRTENFYISIRKHYGKLNRKLPKFYHEYKNEEVQKTYEELREEFSQLSKLLDKLKEYNTKEIPWDKIGNRTKKVSKMLRKLSDKLREEKENAKQQKTEDTQERQQSVTENTMTDIYEDYEPYHELDLSETQKELRYFEQLSSSTKAKLSNFPFLLLTGLAGTGKTHLLCDVVEARITGEKPSPAILVFGELFETSVDTFAQIARQLGLELNKNQLLRLLNSAGKQSGCRTIIAIDALNETRQKSFWKENLGKIIKEIKKYPNIALVVSVRTGFENEVMTEKIREIFVHEKHQGFKFREWEAINKFFKEFNLPLPEIPLLMLEFQLPLFLLLFCKAFQTRAKKNSRKKQKQIFRGHEGATYIFESFVDNVSKKIGKQFNIPNSARENIWDTVIEKIADEMVRQNDDRISEDKVKELVKKAHPSINHDKFIKELDRNLLLIKVPRYLKEKGDYDGFDCRFPFQKFSNHLIGRYFFKGYEKEFGKSNKNLQTAKKFFSEERKLGELLKNSQNRGIVEALSIQCPEHLKGCELVEVAPYLKSYQVAQEAFVESLIWRKPMAFSKDLKNTLAYINAEITKTESGHDNLLNAFLAVAPIPNHPFNAIFLHNHLSTFSMVKRDSCWSTFLHYQYGKRSAVDRLIEWGWSEQDKTHIKDEAICLYAVPLCWFLTTPNRFLRDKATKSLVALLTNRLAVVLALLKQFKDVNDLYVAERLYAVAYGCAIRSKTDKDGLKALSQWVYGEIFKQGDPPAHILLRDYARGIIEVALHEKIKLTMSQGRIEPPFNSDWPKRVPSEKFLKNRYYEKQRFLRVWLSVMYDSGTLGDFGRYVLNSAVEHWSRERLNNKRHRGSIKDLVENFDTSLAQCWVFNRVVQLGRKQELQEGFDESINPTGRSAHKSERIGKKYQWIALHELLARITDNFEFKEDKWSKRIGKYEGSWQLNIRDIDPSCVLKEFPNEKPKDVPDFSNNEIQNQYGALNEEIPDSEWLKKSQDLPDPRKIIEFVDKQGDVWVVLEGTVDWQVDPLLEHDSPTRMLWYIVKGYLVKNRDKDKVFEWAKQQNFMGRWMPESNSTDHVYLGEYPWASSFLYCNNSYHSRNGWTSEAMNKKIPAKILVTDDSYLSSGSSIDCSTNEVVSVKLPTKFIVDKMSLVQNHIDGRFFDKEGNLVAFDPSVFDDRMPRYVLMRKDKLVDFLKLGGYTLVWTLLGSKNIRSDEFGQPSGYLEISGAYTLNSKDVIIGGKRKCFKNHNS